MPVADASTPRKLSRYMPRVQARHSILPHRGTPCESFRCSFAVRDARAQKICSSETPCETPQVRRQSRRTRISSSSNLAKEAFARSRSDPRRQKILLELQDYATSGLKESTRTIPPEAQRLR